MGNWKSDENIEQFINNSYEPSAKDFLDKGYGFHIDGYSHFHHLEHIIQ